MPTDAVGRVLKRTPGIFDHPGPLPRLVDELGCDYATGEQVLPAPARAREATEADVCDFCGAGGVVGLCDVCGDALEQQARAYDPLTGFDPGDDPGGA